MKKCAIDESPHGHHDEPVSHPEVAIKHLKVAFLVGFGLMGLELVGSHLSGSLSLLADAVHVLADNLALLVSLVAARLALRPRSDQQSYGYHRLEVVAALFNGAILLLMVSWILENAWQRYLNPPEIVSSLMLWISAAGLAINLAMLFVLRPVHHHNINTEGAYLHILGDTLSSVFVVIGAVLIGFTGLMWIDTLASVLVSVIILNFALRLIRQALRILLQGTPKHLNVLKMEETLMTAFAEIKSIEDFHVWELTTHRFVLTAHISAKVATLEELENLREKIEHLLHETYGIHHATLQIEPN